MQELIVRIHDKRILNIKEVSGVFKSLRDGKYLLTIKDYRNRSLNQNAYYWAVVVPAVRKGLYDNGFDEVTQNDDAHTVLKHLFLKRGIVNKQTGEVIDTTGSSAKLTVTEFGEYIEAICKWAVEYLGVVIPSPYEQYGAYEEYVNNLNQEEIAF